MSEQPSPPPGSHAEPQRILVHRSPRYSAFLITGAVAGLVAAVLATLAGPAGPGASRGPLLGYLAVLLGLLGGLVGGVVALLLDRRTRSRR